MNKKRNWKAITTFTFTALAIIYALPSLGLGDVGFFSGWKRLAFGLDLQGGLELRYTVDYKRSIGDNTAKLATLLRDRMIAQKLGKIDQQDQLDPKEVERLRTDVKIERVDYTTARLTLGAETQSAIADVDDDFIARWIDPKYGKGATSDNTIDLVLRADQGSQLKNEIVNQTLDIIRKRIGAFGLVEPDVRRAGDADIDIQLPGVEKSKMNLVRGMVGQTAQLNFRLVGQGSPFTGLKADLDAYSAANQGKVNTLALANGSVESTRKSELLSFFRWVDEQRAGKGEPALIDQDHMVGYQEIRENEAGSKKEIAKGWRAVYVLRNMRVGKDTGTERSVSVGGDKITRAMVAYETTGAPYVSVDFDSQGAEDFGALTTENVDQQLAIMLDDEVKSAPNISEPILGGRCKITLGRTGGDEAIRDANSLVTVLTTGAYSAPVHKVHDHSVGPSLGHASIRDGVVSFAIGAVLVVVFMVFIYRKAGAIAMVGVLVNLTLLIALMVAFNATLTLPGIAGIVLTVGMAVDANVLINERIREELRMGKSFRAALDLGYNRAFWTIFDANVTTALAGFIMLVYTTGPIYGFAVALLAGICTTMFTAVVVTRLVFEWLVITKKQDYVSI